MAGTKSEYEGNGFSGIRTKTTTKEDGSKYIVKTKESGLFGLNSKVISRESVKAPKKK